MLIFSHFVSFCELSVIDLVVLAYILTNYQRPNSVILRVVSN